MAVGGSGWDAVLDEDRRGADSALESCTSSLHVRGTFEDLSLHVRGTFDDLSHDGSFEWVNPELPFLENCSWPGAIADLSCSRLGGLEVQDAHQLEDRTTPPSENLHNVTAKTLGGRKRSAEAKPDRTQKLKQARSSRAVDRYATCTQSKAPDELRWEKLLELLNNEEFRPGARPDRIKGQKVQPGTIFKETPKRRRAHSSAMRPLDKWYNTGGLKSASDRFLSTSTTGLRKRYGKIVREGLPTLRFHEYTLLTRDSETEKTKEHSDGSSLFVLVSETRMQRGDCRESTHAFRQLHKMRIREASLQQRLVELKCHIQEQALVLQEMQRNASLPITPERNENVTVG